MQTIETLLNETAAVLRQFAKPLAVSEAEVLSIRHVRDVPPARYPVVDAIASVQTNHQTADFCHALQAAADELHWRQTYREEDGFDRDYLDSYAWCDVAGPEGPADADGIRVMVGYWGQGLVYPDHAHPPDERYLVLGGSAAFRRQSEPYQMLRPGEVFHVPSGTIHSADMRHEGLLALAVWRHEDLRVRISLTDRGRTVERT